MHILYIVQYFNLPDEAGGGRAYHFARRWVELGHRVTVVTGTVNHKTATVPERFRGKLLVRESVDGIDLIRCASTAAIRRSYRGRLLNFLGFAMLSTVASVFKADGPDVVYASSTPLTVGVPGYLAARRWGCPFVFEVRDLWPDSAVVAGLLRSKPVIGVARAVETTLYETADRIVALTEGIGDGIVAKGIPAGRVHFVPNGVDDLLCDAVAGTDGHPPPPPPLEGRRFRCVYVGAIGMWNGNGAIVDAAARLADREDIEFVMVGDGDQRPELEDRVRSLGLRSFRFAGVLPKRRAVEEILAADVCLICTWDHPFHRMVLANKIFDYLAAGRPVVAAARGEMPRLLERAGAGISVPPDDPEALAEAILSLRSLSADARRAMGLRGRAHVLENYRRRDLADRAESVLRRGVAGQAG